VFWEDPPDDDQGATMTIDMNRRTLSLLATPAVVGALTVAVPALAGTGGEGEKRSDDGKRP
jgi:hypothetical protein